MKIANFNQKIVVGCDIAKEKIAVHISSEKKPFFIKNLPSDIQKLVKKLLEIKPTQTLMEATGGWEEELAIAIQEAGLKVVVLNPGRAKHLLRGLCNHAKTDALDATALMEVLT